jgi:hypothetical protein
MEKEEDESVDADDALEREEDESLDAEDALECDDDESLDAEDALECDEEESLDADEVELLLESGSVAINVEALGFVQPCPFVYVTVLVPTLFAV